MMKRLSEHKMVEQTNLVSFWSKQHTMGTDQRLTRDDLVP